MDNSVSSKITDRFTADLQLRGFNVHEIETTGGKLPGYRRRDFYKISMSTSHMIIHYGGQKLEMDGTFLFFSNPHVPYSIDLLSEKNIGYGCLFTEGFLKASERYESLQELPLFKIGGIPVLALNSEQKEFIGSLYKKMLLEQSSDYVFKGEVIRHYIGLIIHEALKIQSADLVVQHKTASSRISSMFLELLERQFPIESPEQPLGLRTAQDFAGHLSVHVNYLNRSVKEVTGKPTTVHIADRIATEAKALLMHTDWSITDIAYSLGFAYPTYFNNFFKKVTGTVPKSFRGKAVTGFQI